MVDNVDEKEYYSGNDDDIENYTPTQSFDKVNQDINSINSMSYNYDEEDDIIEVNDEAPSDTINMYPSYPAFYNDIINSNETPDAIEMRLIDQDWITPQLRQELIDHSPSAEDMIPDAANESIFKNKIEFTKHAKLLFPYDREFANYKQLDQYLTQFLHSWSILKYRNGNYFKCSYQHHGRKYIAKETSIPRNKQKQLKK